MPVQTHGSSSAEPEADPCPPIGGANPQHPGIAAQRQSWHIPRWVWGVAPVALLVVLVAASPPLLAAVASPSGDHREGLSHHHRPRARYQRCNDR